MTQETPPFVAIISLTLPGSGEPFSANVTLLPQDMLQADGRYKQLQDCTLADLQAFADQLESEVWETYQEIRLVELAKDEQFQMELTIYDAEGDPIAPDGEWLKSVMVAVADVAEETAAPSESEPAETAPIEPEETAEPPEPEIPSPEPAPVEDSGEPQIIVAETEPVHEEAEVAGKTAVSDTPAIAPSRARVRIAGQRRPIGDPTWTAVDIFIEEPALRASQAHALSSMNREVAGVLVGPRPEKQPDGRYLVHIHDTIIAKHTVMHGASVTYTPESWRYLNDVLRERYPDDTAVMVGWYHTHPGFGIFLSGMDLFIHQNFFTQIWHVAFVLDPRASTSGFFCWNRHKTEVKPVDFPWPVWAAGAW
jgi:proteasome lid subunit RPN8/RPN11